MNDIIPIKLANKVQSFTVALQALRDAVALLEQDCNGRKIAQRAGCWDEMVHAKFRIDLLAAERPNRICVLVLGEFKAGKSTLINALVGQMVAATDTFEMTTSIARIIPTEQAASRVVFIDEKTGHPIKTMSLSEFLDFSVAQAQKLKEDRNAMIEGYTQARIFVKSDLDAELVDTPGLGATLDNELNAVDAVSTCDVILWTVDAQNIGGAREAAMLDRIHQSGQPLICALTKADVLEPDEIKPTIDYIADSYSIVASSIFAVSAEKYLNDKKDVGVIQLKEHIQTAVAAKSAMLRERALIAQASDISSEIISCLSLVDAGVSEALRDAKENRDALLAIAHNVTDRLCNEFATAVEHQLRADMETQLSGESDFVREEQIKQALQSSIESLSSSSIFDSVGLKDSYQQLWLDGVKSELQMLQTSLSQIRQEAVHKAVDVAAPVIEKRILAVEQKEKAIQHGLAAVGIFSGVTIGLGNIIFGVLAAAPELYNAYKAYNSADPEGVDKELARIAKAADKFFAEIAQELVDQQLRPELKIRNEQVVISVTNEIARKNSDWPLSIEELTELHDYCVNTKRQLELI